MAKDRAQDTTRAHVPGLWRFGMAVLDEQVAELRVAGQAVELDRSSYDVLLALLRLAGEVATKDELLEAGWPDRVVSENSLAKAVSRLRQALGEDGAALKAVHGYGYRLALPVAFQPVPPEQVEAYPHQAERLREGDRLPHRTGWRLLRRLGEGGAGATFLARSESDELRAIKFATSENGLRGLKREIALARYIRAVKPDLPGVAQVIDWNLAQPPYFLELPHFPDGHLGEWAAAHGGLGAVPLPKRIAMCASLCDAVAGLHEIGVIHKDLKPENLYPRADADGHWQLVLSDLGAGEAMPSPQLAQLDITMTLSAAEVSSRAGSLLYVAPEIIAGEMPTQRSDVFSLGVLLYQLAVGDLRHSLAPGWEADIDDELLREDVALAAASNPERRQIDARTLAERLRMLDARREMRERERHERLLAEQREQALQRERGRRRLWLTAAVASGIGLIGALGMYGYAEKSRRTAVAEATRADREAGKARKLVEFLTEGVLRQADPFVGGNGGDITLRQAIDNAAKDVDTRFGSDADTAAVIHGTLGAVYTGLNNWDAGVAHYRAQLQRLRNAQPRNLPEIARSSGALCMVQVWQGDPALRRKSCEQARDDYVAANLEPDLPEVFLALVDSREDKYRQGLARLEPRLPRIRASGDDETRNYAFWFAALLYNRLGLIPEAERAQAERVALNGAKSARSMDLAWSLTEHGRLLLSLGRIDAGKAELRRAQRMFEQVAGPGHPHGHAPVIYLADLEVAQGEWRQAQALAAPIYRDLLAKVKWEHWTMYAALAAMTAEAELGNDAAARQIIAAFDSLNVQGLDPDRYMPFMREPRWSGYAATYLALGELAQAERYIRKLEQFATQPDASPLLIARVECLEGRLQLARGERAAALANARNCRKRILDATSVNSPLLGTPDRLLAALGEKP